MTGDELLHHTSRTRVARVSGGVIRKELSGAGAVHRVRHETAILERLSGLAGVPRLMPCGEPTVLLLADTGGVALSGEMAAVRGCMPDVLSVALGLAGIVTRIHLRGVMHKDINPSNVVVSGTTPMLIDYDLASTFAVQRPSFTHQSEVAGTLAYLAPEQSGRTGRPVDHRADLYALGATLYELVTGEPPFGDGDALQLIHDHLARIPVAPELLNPAVPPDLSRIILRLLEKEPDQRYQSAAGLEYDLRRVLDVPAPGDHRPLVLGERDFALRLAPPSRLAGRDGEIGELRATFEQAVLGRARGLLVAGAPGVGKTALIDELRPIVTAAGGWFVSGKFDQYRNDVNADAISQAMRALARLLLAEPEAALSPVRSRLRADLGDNVDVLTRAVPEFTALLGPPSEAGGSAPALETGRRLVQAELAVLRSVVSPARPLAIVIDDLQWATEAPLALVDAVLTAEQLPGLLLVGAYRDGEVDAAHPLSALRSRWDRLDAVPPTMHLANLPPDDLGTMLAAMLRLGPEPAARLAGAVGERTAGNPFDTVELVNALRRDDVLTPGDDGWRWDAETVRRYVGAGDVLELLAARIDRLPRPTRDLLEVMACLDGEVELALLQFAAGLTAGELAPALEDGLLVTDGGDLSIQETVRFRHDRVLQAAYGRMPPARQQARHLELARRLAGTPGYATAAAGQYLPAVAALTDPAERHRVAVLFRTAAAGISRINPVAAERFLATATGLLSGIAPVPGDPLPAALDIERHAALYRLGRLAEADDLYRRIESREPDPMDLTTPACVQISSLTNRGRAADAVTLGVDLLRRLGVRVPSDDEIGPEIGQGFDALIRWVDDCDLDTDLARPDISDPRTLAVATVVNHVMTPAVFSAPQTMAWLVVQAWRLWAGHGPSAMLITPFADAASALNASRADYRAGAGAVRHALAFGAARGYEPETSQVRFLYAVCTGPWFEPLEETVALFRVAHERLVHNGDPHYAGLALSALIPQLLDSSPTLEPVAAAVDACITYAIRTGNEVSATWNLPYRQFLRCMRGETREPGGYADETFDDERYVASLGPQRLPAAYFHVNRAVAAAIFGDDADLAHHSAAAMPLLPATVGGYATALGHLLRALALANEVRGSEPAGHGAALAELDICRQWLADRAADAPLNFAHLAGLADAERAWAVGDRWAALQAFDTALAAPGTPVRPWHRALITERAAVFHQECGLPEHSGRLLAEAQRLYDTWGATGKVEQMRQRHRVLRGAVAPARPGEAHGRSTTISAGAIDLLAVLRASQALSSETDLDRLRTRVVEVVGAMTGATTVHILLRDEDLDAWFLTTGGGEPVTVDEADARGLLPTSAFRYVERTRGPLLVDDATRDDRFARDAYLAGSGCCSLLVVPIEVQGSPRAILLLENRLIAGGFTVDRLDAVLLIAGQLAVSLDNAMLYASLSRKVAERTEALAEMNRQLEQLSATDPLTGLANRRHLDEVLDAEWTRMRSAGRPLAVAMVDIDHFKLYNDHYGHQLGDTCLRRVAAALHGSVRDTDLVARYGGEEFILVLPGADLGTADQIARRANEAVAALLEPHARATAGIVTVSIGIASTVPSDTGTHVDLVKSADAALYEAKRDGRDQVGGGPSPDLVPGAGRVQALSDAPGPPNRDL